MPNMPQNTSVQTQFPQENFHIQIGQLGVDGGVTTVHGQSTIDANLCGHQVHLTGIAATGFVDLINLGHWWTPYEK